MMHPRLAAGSLASSPYRACLGEYAGSCTAKENRRRTGCQVKKVDSNTDNSGQCIFHIQEIWVALRIYAACPAGAALRSLSLRMFACQVADGFLVRCVVDPVREYPMRE